MRKANENAAVIDIRGEFTGFAEGVLMEAYEQAGRVRAIILDFEGLWST